MTKDKFKYFFSIYGISVAALVLLIIGFFIAIGGHVFEYGTFDFVIWISDFYSNFGTEFISIAITVLILDKLSKQQQEKLEEERHKKGLLNKVRSQINNQAKLALEQLATIGLLFNGELEHADFSHSNLHQARFISYYKLGGAKLRGVNFRGARLTEAWLNDADLENASLRYAKLQKSHLFNTVLQKADLQYSDFRGAYFFGADLRNVSGNNINIEDANIWETNLFGASLSEEMLMKAKRLRGSTLPNGSRYNGKFNLIGDLEDAKKDGVDVDNPTAMAAWYVVSTGSYEEGQNTT